MDMKYKICGALASTALMLGLMVPQAFAEDPTGDPAGATLEISGNGAQSINTIDVKFDNSCVVKQDSNTTANVGISISSNTGGNEANNNTGGDTSVTSGAIAAKVTVTTTGGSNTSTNPCCCNQECSTTTCSPEATGSALISGNGFKSDNDIKVSNKKTSKLTQKTKTTAGVGVTTNGKTGKNKANSNTGGGTATVDTGKIKTTVDVTTTGGSNTSNP